MRVIDFSNAPAMMRYRLSRLADQDFDEIYTRGAELFGVDQADEYAAGLTRVFEFLASFPRAARERIEANPPVRAHPYKSHLIVYIIDNEEIVIVRIRHGHEDWLADPL